MVGIFNKFLILIFVTTLAAALSSDAISSNMTVLECFKQAAVSNWSNDPGNKPILKDFLPTEPTIADEVIRRKWITERGLEHIENLRKLSKDLHLMYKNTEFDSLLKIKKEYAEFGDYSFRIKTQDSIFAKLMKKDLGYYKNGSPGIKTFDEAKAVIGDAIGVRIILKTNEKGEIASETIQKLADKLGRDIRDGLPVTSLENYHSSIPGTPYLTPEQVQKIKHADVQHRQLLQQKAGEDIKLRAPIIIISEQQAIKASGYSSIHININEGGVRAELQIRGPKMQEASDFTHLFYDIKMGKPLPDQYKNRPIIVTAAEKFRTLTDRQQKAYDLYIKEYHEHARRVESGFRADPPRLPPDIPADLSYENLVAHLK